MQPFGNAAGFLDFARNDLRFNRFNEIRYHRTWLGTLSGGSPLRNSACSRSASRRCCASRDACSGSGPGLAQPKKTRVSPGIKNIQTASFFMEQLQHNQADACGNVSRKCESFKSLKSGASGRLKLKTENLNSSLIPVVYPMSVADIRARAF